MIFLKKGNPKSLEFNAFISKVYYNLFKNFKIILAMAMEKKLMVPISNHSTKSIYHKAFKYYLCCFVKL